MPPRRRGGKSAPEKVNDDEPDQPVNGTKDPNVKHRQYEREQDEGEEKEGKVAGRVLRYVKDPDFAQFCMAMILVIILFSLPPLVGSQISPNKIDTNHCSRNGFPNGSITGGDLSLIHI